MKGSLIVGFASVLSLAALACGGSQPAVEAPTSKTETRSAVAPASGPRDQTSLRASMATQAEAAAKALEWTDKPAIAAALQAAFGAIGDGAFAITSVEIQISEAAGNWTFRARGGDSGILGPSITIAGAPATGQAYNAPMGNNAGAYFQAPRAGRAIGTKDFAETIDLTGESAYSVEITKLTIAADGKTGTATGRFVYMQKESGADFPAMRAAGTFDNATVRVWKK